MLGDQRRVIQQANRIDFIKLNRTMDIRKLKESLWSYMAPVIPDYKEDDK